MCCAFVRVCVCICVLTDKQLLSVTIISIVTLSMCIHTTVLLYVVNNVFNQNEKINICISKGICRIIII